MTDINTDPRYQWWRDALAGKPQNAILNEPQCGFYSMGKGADREAVVIYAMDDGGLVADAHHFNPRGLRQGDEDFVLRLWPSCYSHPITSEVYWDAVEEGRWADTEGMVSPPKGVDAVPIGSNAPAEVNPFEEVTQEAENAIGALDAALPKPGDIPDKALADKLANAKDRLREIWAKAEGYRKAEKKPHDDAAKAVQLKWTPLQATIADAGARAEKAVAAYLKWAHNEQQRLQRAAEAKAREEERERLAKLAAIKEDEPVPEALIKPIEAPPPPERPRAGGGLSGRRTGLRKTYRAKIVDYQKALGYFGQTDEVKAVVQSLADALARSAAHIAAEGCEVIEEEEGTT